MMRTLRLFGLLSLVLLLVLALPGEGHAGGPMLDPLLRSQLASAPADVPLAVIITYHERPSEDALLELTGRGIAVAPLQHLPMVGALATPAQVEAILQLPGVRSVYADRPLTYFLRNSVELIGAVDVWEEYGYTGAGVGVAVIDTGIDGTHPDLEFGSKTVQNVKILGIQDAAGVELSELSPVHYQENLPNTDTTGGHGTHVAGIVAGSGKASAGYYRGVAPDADLIGLSTGEGIMIFTAVAGFEWAMAHEDEYNIRVINCSWGDMVPGFDPEHPVNVASKAAHDAGMAVVFAAGNSGSTTDTLNTYSVAPWVISVAAGEKDAENRLRVSYFSSRGIPGDDFYHPTLTAPGYAIVSARASTGLATSATTTPADPLFIPPDYLAQYLPYYTTANGTSMAAPHVAGVIALMLQAQPELTPDVIKRVLINSATPMPLHQEYAAGAGYLNAKSAVSTARRIRNIRSYYNPHTARTEELYDLTERWEGTVGPSVVGLGVPLLPVSDIRSIEVETGTLSLEVAVDWTLVVRDTSFASDLSLYLYDPAGALAARSEVMQSIYAYGNETVHVDAPAPGTWRVEVRGFLNAPQSYRATSNAVVLLTYSPRLEAGGFWA